MFNTPRSHRWVTIPAAVAVLLAMVTSGSIQYFLLFAPPVVALPWIIHAAVRRTESATAAALITVRVAGGIIVVAGLLGTPDNAAAGLIIMSAGIALLVATGTHRQEIRLAAATSVTGVLVLVVSFALAWVGADLRLVASGALGLVVGGLLWALEVRTDAQMREVIPTMKIAV